MKQILIFSFFLIAGFAKAVPDPKITWIDISNGYIIVAGVLTENIDKPVGIKVTDAGITYATLTDLDGKWAMVVRGYSVRVTVEAWDLNNPKNRSKEITGLAK